MQSRFRLFILSIAALSFAGCSSSTASTGSTPTTPAPQLTVTVTSTTFASTTVGQSSTAQILTIVNTGSATATIASLVASDTTNFAMMSTCGASLGVQATCTATVNFTPKSAGTFSDIITITSNASSAALVSTFTGVGTPVVAPTAPIAALSTTSLTFPFTVSGSASATQSVTLSNTGTATLTGIAIALAGTNAGIFAETSNCALTLPAGASCSIALTFNPAAASTTYTASLTLADNASGAPQTVSLSGTSAAPVAAPQIALSGSSFTFATTTVGSSAQIAAPLVLTNTGNATLNGIAIAIGGGTASSAFTDTTTCATTLAAGASCNISLTFRPSTTGTFGATLTVSGTGATPATASLAGSGIAPAASFSTINVSFPATTVGISASGAITLSNTGGAPLLITSILLGGTNAAVFAESTTCGATLAAGASCSIGLTFTPAAASPYAASVTVTDNAAGSPMTLTLSGSGTTATITRTFYIFPEPDLGVTPLYALVDNALKTIDMTMYELVDTTFSADLVAACNHGVKVRVILDQNLEKSSNTAAYNQLNATTNCSAAWANPAFQATHQKTLIVDGTQVAILSLNLTSRYYSTTRDFALVENDPVDIAAIQTTFNTDFNSTTDYSYIPPNGNDLIWSPTNAQSALLGVINGATKTLLVENEEMSATNIVTALEAACQRGVVVHIAMVDTGSYHANFSALEAAGCGVHTYPNTATGLYIHAKAMVADYGLTTQSVYMGSINFSNASMTQNRELGLYLTDTPGVSALFTVMTADYAGASAY